jgi:hypothetical protein
MALLTNQQINRLGLTPTFAAPSASDTFIPTNRTIYYGKTGSTATTYTFVVPTARDVIPNVDIANLVNGPNTSVDKIIGPFNAEIFADPTTGLITVTTSNQTGVTVGVFDLQY